MSVLKGANCLHKRSVCPSRGLNSRSASVRSLFAVCVCVFSYYNNVPTFYCGRLGELGLKCALVNFSPRSRIDAMFV